MHSSLEIPVGEFETAPCSPNSILGSSLYLRKMDKGKQKTEANVANLYGQITKDPRSSQSPRPLLSKDKKRRKSKVNLHVGNYVLQMNVIVCVTGCAGCLRLSVVVTNLQTQVDGLQTQVDGLQIQTQVEKLFCWKSAKPSKDLLLQTQLDTNKQ